MSSFEQQLMNHLGFIPRTHENQDEGFADRFGGVDAVSQSYLNKAPHLQFYRPLERGSTDQVDIYGATVQVNFYEDRQKFPYAVGLRFFPTVNPINEILYGD